MGVSHCRLRSQPFASRIQLGLALLALACVAAMCTMLAHPAFAQESGPKHPIPSITKMVSLDKKRYAATVKAKPGDTLHYQISMTMPDGTKDLERIDYTAIDKPHASLALVKSSVTARLMNSDGRSKASLSPSVNVSGNRLTFAFGNLKDSCSTLSDTDRLVVRYDAVLASNAEIGEYPNLARLVYDLGEGPEQTVDVMTKALVERQVKTKPSSSQTRVEQSQSQLPKTGDALASFAVPAIVVACMAGLIVALARKRRA